MSKMNKPRPRLGRGINSLLSLSVGEDVVAPAGESPLSPVAEPVAAPLLGAAVIDLPIETIQPNPHQPRREFNEASIRELAVSLKSTGLIQPIVVRKTERGYELIAGERRLRAAKVAGMDTLPAIVKDVDGYTQAQMALIENIQREDLNPIDRAVAYRMLIEQLGLTQGELAGRLGEDRTAVAHYLRLLELAEPVREMVRTRNLSVGHGKLLAGVTDPILQQQLAERAVGEGLSVRELERVLQEISQDGAGAESVQEPAKPSAHIRDLEKRISQQLGMRVQVKWSADKRKGKLVIFYTLDQFDDLKNRLGVVLDE